MKKQVERCREVVGCQKGEGSGMEEWYVLNRKGQYFYGLEKYSEAIK